MKKEISWIILLWAAFLIMLTFDFRKIKYLPNLLHELRRVARKGSRYNEDSDYMLVPKPNHKEF